MKRRVTEILRELNMTANLRGYEYVREAILMCIDNPELVHAMTKELYPAIAAKYNASASRVERTIRHAIEIAYTTTPEITLHKYYFSGKKPTNSEFIATITDLIRLDLEEAQAKGA